MKQPKTYESVDDYIEQSHIANENSGDIGEIFDDAINVLQHMKNISSSGNVVDISGVKPMDITAEEYDELIEWLETLDKTRH